MTGGGTLEHGTVVEIDGRGVLVRGPSGSGKTALAVELLSRSRACGIPSALVADDYAFLSRDGESEAVIAEVPDRIAGLIELRGCGVVPVGPARHVPRTRLVLSVALVPPEEAERVADPSRRAVICGAELPELALPAGAAVSAAFAVFGWLGLSERII
ncbi:HPr kinase/phosphorylase [Oricola thermophila]|uniref:HPr kinase/phosphorylase n=1 Tax=Oricola thermophila TaxID=2742145 RepID=A0A6N1VK78_9HYPH|nr:HPr kinase/phosphorylase [Oricola thermophila]QKV19802.1 HPr kinase/phosphorylase [Oricola thermophila]